MPKHLKENTTLASSEICGRIAIIQWEIWKTATELNRYSSQLQRLSDALGTIAQEISLNTELSDLKGLKTHDNLHPPNKVNI